jgi:hypothetical protein
LQFPGGAVLTSLHCRHLHSTTSQGYSQQHALAEHTSAGSWCAVLAVLGVSAVFCSIDNFTAALALRAGRWALGVLGSGCVCSDLQSFAYALQRLLC